MAASRADALRKAMQERRQRDYSAVDRFEPEGGPEAAAFFDFDKTLLHGDAGVIFGRSYATWAFRQGRQLSPAARAVFHAYAGARFGGLIAKEAFYRSLYLTGVIKRSRLVELAYRTMEGLPTTSMSEHLERVWDEVLAERLYPQMQDVMNRHRALGQRVVIVSTGLRPIVEHARHYIGDDVDVIACDPEEEDGYFTGTVVGPLWGEHKADALRAYARRHGVDLAKSYAYSDHYSDLAFLAAVGHPVAVNPRGKLRRRAVSEGWTVLDLPPPVGRWRREARKAAVESGENERGPKAPDL